MMLALSRKSVSKKLVSMADEIVALRRSLSPVLDWLIASKDKPEIETFVQWDMAIARVHDSLLREHAKLVAGDPTRDVRLRMKLLTVDLKHQLSELESFKSRTWWGAASESVQ